MFVEIVIVEAHDGRLEDVRGGGRSGGDPPASVVVQESGLCLGSGKTELAGKGLAKPGGRILAEIAESSSNLVIRQPGDVATPAQNLVEAIWRREAHCAGTVLANRGR